jgi:hypothetical protein
VLTIERSTGSDRGRGSRLDARIVCAVLAGLTLAAGLIVLLSGAAGASRDSSAAVAHYCDVLIRTEQTATQNNARAPQSVSQVWAQTDALEQVARDRDAAAPPSIKGDYDEIVYYGQLTSPEGDRPSEVAKEEKAVSDVNSYIKSKCDSDIRERELSG